MSEERLWKFRKPEWMNSATARSAGVYAAGALFSLSFFIMLDAAVWSHSAKNGSDPPVHINFIDWLPLIFSSLGMLIINSIEKNPSLGRLVLVLGIGRCVEGESGVVPWVCESGRGNGGGCYGVGAKVCGSWHGAADALYGNCEFGCEWFGYVELGGALDQPEYGG